MFKSVLQSFLLQYTCSCTTETSDFDVVPIKIENSLISEKWLSDILSITDHVIQLQHSHLSPLHYDIILKSVAAKTVVQQKTDCSRSMLGQYCTPDVPRFPTGRVTVIVVSRWHSAAECCRAESHLQQRTQGVFL